MSDTPEDGMGGEAPDEPLAGSPELEALAKAVPISAEQIVAMLKSPDHKERGKAMDELYPGGTASLVIVTDADKARANFSMASTQSSNVAHLFTAFTWAGCELGKALNMSLNWTKDPEERNDRIVVAQPGVAVQ